MMLELNLALNYLKGRPIRSIFTIFSIVIGVMMMFGLNGLAPALKESFSRSTEQASLASVDLFLSRDDGGFFRQEYLENVAAVQGVDAVAGLIVRAVAVPPEKYSMPDGNDVVTMQVFGIDTAITDPDFNLITAGGRRLAEGRLLEPGDHGVAIISQQFAQGVGLSLGESIEIPGSSGFESFRIVGLLDDPGLLLGSTSVYLSMEDAQSLLNVPGRINTIMGRYAEGANTEALDTAIQGMFGNGYELAPVGSGTDVWAAVLEIMDYIFTLVGILALGLAGLIMFNTFRTSVVERKQDIGMLRAVGATRRVVMRTILIESLILAISGTLLGVVIGVFFAYGFRVLANDYFQGLMGAPLGQVRFTAVTIMATILFGLGIPLGSTLIPARSASRVSPLEALRPTTIEQEATIRRGRLIIGLILLALALVGLFTGEFSWMSLGMVFFLLALGLLGPLLMTPITSFFSRVFYLLFAQEGEIAAGNIARQPRRAAITTTSLMISLAILIGLGGMLSSTYGGALIYLEDSLKSDYILLPGALVVTNATVGAGPELAESVRRLPGVSDVATMRQIDLIDEEGQSTRLIGIDPASYARVGGLSWVEGDESTFAELADPGAVIINTRYSITYGVEMGDSFTVPSDSGPVTLRVVGIGLDYLNMKLPSIYIQQDALTREWGVRNDALLLVNTEDGADIPQLEEDLLALMRTFPGFGVLSNEQLMESQNNLASQATIGFNIVLAVIAAPALIGLANTMGINVLERTREIGMLRAVGARRRQVRRMIVAESLMLSVMGAAFGVLAGTWLSVLMIGALDLYGIRLAYSFPLAGVITATALGLICGVLAALIPARRASDLEIVAALAYE